MKKFSKKGFTLIELLVTMAISGILSIGLFSFLNTHQKVFSMQTQSVDMQQNARVALDFISNYIMNAGYDPKGSNFDAIDKSSNKTFIKLYTDLDGNGILPEEWTETETIAFSFDDKKHTIYRIFKKNVERRQSLVKNIVDLSFKYDIPPPKTKRVNVSITARTEKEDPAYKTGFNLYGTKEDGTCRTITLMSDIILRNKV